MSIRYIGQDIYVPSAPGNFAKGHTRVVRVTTLPDDTQHKKQRANMYRDELDRQVQELRSRKEKEKQKEREEDQRREREFYNSLKVVQVSPPQNFHHQRKSPSGRSSSHQKAVSFSPTSNRGSINPEADSWKNPKSLDISASRLAYIGRRKIGGELWGGLHDEEQALIDKRKLNYLDEEYSQNKISQRRRQFNEEIDRNLRDAFSAVDRSKIQAVDIEEEVGKLRRKLKTEADEPSSYDYQPYSGDDRLYSLPYRRAGAIGHQHQHQNHHSPNNYGDASRVHYYQ